MAFKSVLAHASCVSSTLLVSVKSVNKNYWKLRILCVHHIKHCNTPETRTQ